MNNRTFWAGFGVALIVILLPVLILIDARSSSDDLQKIPKPREKATELLPAGSSGGLPSPLSGEEDSSGKGPAMGPGKPSREQDRSGTRSRFRVLQGPVESRLDPSPRPPGTFRERDSENPEIVFSPGRVRKSLEKDRVREKSYHRLDRSRSGIREIVYDPKQVYTIRTAVSHVTLIDLPEEAKEVYLGDSRLFLAEVFGSRVKIKPITYDPGTTTNMIVYTVHKQFAFRLRVVSEGREDDLLTFYSPKSETVVNLDPIRRAMEQKLVQREKNDLHEKALSTLKSAGATIPFNVTGVKDGVTGTFLGFSSLGPRVYALFEVANSTGSSVRLTNIRLRMFNTSLFWEGEKEWVEGQDFSQSYQVDVPPRGRKRMLLLADPPPLKSSREGYLAELRVDGSEGKRRVFELEARGGNR